MQRLRDQFELSEKQAKTILGMRLQQLTALEVEKIDKEYRELIEKIEEYRSILENPQFVLNLIKEDLADLKEKYGDERRTEIVGEYVKLGKADFIVEENVAVTISNAGYIKRMPIYTYRQQQRGGKGVTGGNMKEDDFSRHLFIANTHDYILFFSNKGKVHWLKVYDIPNLSRTARGRALPNIIQFEPGETFTSMLPVHKFDERFVVMATRQGIIKRTALSNFSRPMRGGIRALSLGQDDVLIGAELTSGEQELMLATANGLAIRFGEQDVRNMGRSARGVKGITLRQGDTVTDLIAVADEASVLTVCENGYGKRTSFEEYRRQSRGGIGIINIKTTERNGKVVDMMSVKDD